MLLCKKIASMTWPQNRIKYKNGWMKIRKEVGGAVLRVKLALFKRQLCRRRSNLPSNVGAGSVQTYGGRSECLRWASAKASDSGPGEVGNANGKKKL